MVNTFVDIKILSKTLKNFLDKIFGIDLNIENVKYRNFLIFIKVTKSQV